MTVINSPLPSSITSTTAEVQSSLSSLSSLIAVSSVLADLTTALDSHHSLHLFSRLQSVVTSLESTHSDASSEWTAAAALIATETSSLSSLSNSLSSSLSASQSRLDALTVQLDAAAAADSQYFHLLRQRTAASDLTLLPRRVLLRLVPFLRPRELARALRVSRRWRAHLDRGQHWKALLLPVIIQLLQQRFTQSQASASAATPPPPPPTFSLTFTPLQLNPRPKAVLSKAEVLRNALALHQRKVDAVMGDFEALSSKQGDEGNEKSILRVMVDLKRDEMGRRRVMIGEMWEKAEALRGERAAIARQLKALELRIHRERDLKRGMRAEHAEAQRWFEGRVSRVRAMEGGGSKKEERDGLLKKTAVLVRGVEGLQRDIARARQEKAEYETKIAELRQKIKQVVW